MNIVQKVYAVCKEYGVEPEIALAIIAVESEYNPNAVGDNGKAFGLMQIWLESAQTVGFKGTKEELMDIDTNINYGVKYIRHVMYRWTEPKDIISGYNAGPNGVTRPYKNTEYVEKVYRKYITLRIWNDVNKLLPFIIPVVLIAGVREFMDSKKD